jgi:hypothetical protein
MRIDKKPLLVLLASCVLVLAVGQGACAQMMDKLAKTTPQERAAIQTAFMKSKLGLQGEELSKVEAINMKFAEQAEPIIKGSSGPIMKMRQMKAMQQEKDGALKGVLTPQQFSTYEAAKAEMKQNFEAAIAKKAAANP